MNDVNFPLTTRTRIAAGALLLLTLPLYLQHTAPTLAVTVFLLGAAIGPHLVSLFGLTERTAPAGRISQTMAVIVSSLILGQALGSMSAGALADAQGYQGAFALATLGGLISLTVTTAFMRTRWYVRTEQAPTAAHTHVS